MQEIPHLSLQIATYQVISLPTGLFGLDGGAMFGTVPKVLWEKSHPADDFNRIQLEARALLLLSDQKKIIIDTGNGADFIIKYGKKLGQKFADMYDISTTGKPAILDALNRHGLKPEDITDVILTHLHFDHAGGGTTTQDNNLVPTFPKATYYVQKDNLETAKKPNLREKASYFPANFEPLLNAGVLEILDGPLDDLLPGISVKLSYGHTKGQQNVFISDNNNTLVYCADVIPTTSHVRLAWVMGYDLNPVLLIEEKRKILKEAGEKNWFLFFEHDPYIDCAQVKYDPQKQNWAVSEKFSLTY